MKQNVHNIERIIRIIIGLGLISLVFVGPQTPWGWLGFIPLATGIIGWFIGRLPDDWFEGRPEFRIDRDEILMIGHLSAPTLEDGDVVTLGLHELVYTDMRNERKGTEHVGQESDDALADDEEEESLVNAD